MKMLMLTDLQRLPVPEQFRIQSRAYLDAALNLATDLCDESTAGAATYADGAVAMYLANHALELFLKGAILELRPGENFVAQGHEVVQLEAWYRKLYPNKAFRLSMPLGDGEVQLAEPNPDLERELAKRAADLRKRMPTDQFLRYPADRKGTPWEQVEPMAAAYIPAMYRTTLQRLRDDFARIEALLKLAASEGPTR
jgi:hypothetical protein